MKRNTSNWSNFCIPLSRAARAGLSSLARALQALNDPYWRVIVSRCACVSVCLCVGNFDADNLGNYAIQGFVFIDDVIVLTGDVNDHLIRLRLLGKETFGATAVQPKFDNFQNVRDATHWFSAWNRLARVVSVKLSGLYSTSCFPLRSVTALHAGSQQAAPYAACAINSNAINSTGLGQWPRRACRCESVGLLSGIFVEKCHFFGDDDSFGYKTQQMFWTWSVRVCVQNFAIVQHGVSEEIGSRQDKQTLKYLVGLVPSNMPTITSTDNKSVLYSWCYNIQSRHIWKLAPVWIL